MPQELDLYIDESQAANAAPLIGAKRKPAKISYVPLITVGDELTLRLWFYRGEFGATTLTNVTKTAAEVIFFAKASLATGSPALFGAAAIFVEITDERGDKGYEATFTLDTPEGRAAVAAGERIPIYCDVVTDEKTSQLTMGFRPDAYNGDPVPTPAVEALLEQVLDAAADAITAANDATAASANKADKLGPGFDGQVLVADADGNLEASGLTIAPANSVAGALELMRGDDARAGLLGGITFLAASGGGITNVPLGTGDFDISVLAKLNATGTQLISSQAYGPTLGNWSLSTTGGTITLTLIAPGSFTATAAAPADYAAKLHTYGVRRVGGAVSITVDGQIVATHIDDVTWALDPVYYIGQGFSLTPVEYLMRLVRVLNFVPTTDESDGIAKGESRGRLAYRGFDYVSSGTFSKVGGDQTGSISAASATGFTYAATGGTFAYFSPDALALAPKIESGRVTRFSCDIVYTGTAPSEAAKASIQWAAGAGNFYATSIVGDRHTFEITASQEWAIGFPAVVLFLVNGGTVVVSNWSMDYEGTALNLPPETCLVSNDWVDVSGNCLDLRAVGGCKANNPRESYVRVCTVTTASGAAVGASAQASVGSITGADAYATAVIAGLKQWAAVSAVRKSAPASHIKRGVVAEVATAGVLSIYAEADATGGTEAANTTYELSVIYK